MMKRRGGQEKDRSGTNRFVGFWICFPSPLLIIITITVSSCMTKLRLELAAPGYVTGGSNFQGRVVVTVNKEQRFREVLVTIVGRAHGMLSSTSQSGNYQVTTTFWKDCQLIGVQQTAGHCPSDQPFAVLGPGDHNFDFSVPIYEYLPASFDRVNMYIRYTLTAAIGLLTPGRESRLEIKTALFLPGTYDSSLFDAAVRSLSLLTVKDDNDFYLLQEIVF